MRSTRRSTRRCPTTRSRTSRRSRCWSSSPTCSWSTPTSRPRDVAELIELLKAEPGQVQLRLVRQRHAAPSLGRAVQEHGRGRHGACALQGGGAGAGRRHGRARADHVRQPAPLDRAYPGRQVARPCRHDQGARAPRCPSCRPSPRRLPGYETYSWNAFFAPAGTPPEVIDRLNAAAVRRWPIRRCGQAQSFEHHSGRLDA